jgi:hypothetical protein
MEDADERGQERPVDDVGAIEPVAQEQQLGERRRVEQRGG